MFHPIQSARTTITPRSWRRLYAIVWLEAFAEALHAKVRREFGDTRRMKR